MHMWVIDLCVWCMRDHAWLYYSEEIWLASTVQVDQTCSGCLQCIKILGDWSSWYMWCSCSYDDKFKSRYELPERKSLTHWFGLVHITMPHLLLTFKTLPLFQLLAWFELSWSALIIIIYLFIIIFYNYLFCGLIWLRFLTITDSHLLTHAYSRTHTHTHTHTHTPA